MIECCPDCGSKRVKSKGIEKNERLGDSCVVLVTGYGCRDCECEFREFMVTHWTLEITKHDIIERAFIA